ncbi:MAG: hypothetical protein ABR927_12400 [Bacteroidales bacterium]
MINKRIMILVILLTSVSSAISSGANQLPKTLDYKLDLKIDYNNDKLYGKCEMTISNGTNQPIEKVPILLYRLLSVKSVENENHNPLSFTQNVISISGWEKLQVNYVEISLNKTLAPGEIRKINLVYDGYLLGYSDEGMRYVKDHIDRNFTIIRTDGYGYPVIGYPNEKDMMAIVNESYDFLLTITVPDGIMVVTGGELVEQKKTGDETTFVYRSKKPSWRLDIAMTDYKILEKGKDKIYYFKTDSAGAKLMMTDFDKSLELYTSWFGALKDYKGFTIIEVPEGYGSQADITSILITADNFNKPGEVLTLYHEASHLWNVKNLDPQPCRFESEGLAKFSEFLLSEKLDHKKNAISQAAQGYLDEARKDFLEKPESQNIPIKDYGVKDMTYYSYTLGMVAFAVFYDLVGQDNFNKIIGSFYSNYNSKGATLDEFINHCKKSAPVDLERFFDDWIYSTKAIKLVAEGKTFKELIQYYKRN